MLAAVEVLADTLLAGPRADPLRPRLDGAPDTARAIGTDLLRVAYRLLHLLGVQRRGGVLPLRAALAGLRLDVLPRPARRDLGEPLALLAEASLPDDPVALGGLHEGLLGWRPHWDGDRLRLVPDPHARKAAGAFYTRPALV